MKRIICSVAILAVLLVITIAGNITISKLSHSAYEALTRIEDYAISENSAAAESEVNSLIGFLSDKRHIFEMFIKREYISSLCVNVEGLHAYIDSETWRDLESETAKAKQQLYSLRHLFFSII